MSQKIVYHFSQPLLSSRNWAPASFTRTYVSSRKATEAGMTTASYAFPAATMFRVSGWREDATPYQQAHSNIANLFLH